MCGHHRALLRHHPPPSVSKLEEVAEEVARGGMGLAETLFDHSSSKALAASLEALAGSRGEEAAETARQLVLRGMQVGSLVAVSPNPDSLALGRRRRRRCGMQAGNSRLQPLRL